MTLTTAMLQSDVFLPYVRNAINFYRVTEKEVPV